MVSLPEVAGASNCLCFKAENDVDLRTVIFSISALNVFLETTFCQYEHHRFRTPSRLASSHNSISFYCVIKCNVLIRPIVKVDISDRLNRRSETS